MMRGCKRPPDRFMQVRAGTGSASGTHGVCLADGEQVG